MVRVTEDGKSQPLIWPMRIVLAHVLSKQIVVASWNRDGGVMAESGTRRLYLVGCMTSCELAKGAEILSKESINGVHKV